MNKKRKEKIFSSILLLFSTIYIFASFKLKMGSLGNPGAGVYPLIVSFLLLGCSLIYFIQVFYRSKDSAAVEKKENQIEEYIPPLGIAVSIAAYPFFLSHFKFFISTFLATFSILMLLKYKGILISLVIAFVMTFLSYMIFVKLLGVVLPFGEVERCISNLIETIL